MDTHDSREGAQRSQRRLDGSRRRRHRLGIRDSAARSRCGSPQEGAPVVVSDVRRDPREGGEPTEDLIDADGRRVRADRRRRLALGRHRPARVRTRSQRFGRLDVMVNNAAIAGPASKPLLETTEEDWDAIMAVNLRGVFLCCKRAIGEMLEQEPIGEVRGRVINISSQHGMVGSPGHVAYSTSKGGVINLTHQLAVDYGRHGILVNAVAPGKILTGSPEQVNEEAIAYSHARTPFFAARPARGRRRGRRVPGLRRRALRLRAPTCSSTAAGWRTEPVPLGGRAQCAVEIVHQVGRVLHPDREADRPRLDAGLHQLLGAEAEVRGVVGRAGQALHTPRLVA